MPLHCCFPFALNRKLLSVILVSIQVKIFTSLFFWQVFRTCQGHTEGEIVVTYVVITSHYLYLLRPSNRPNKFIRDVAITYKELDYISVILSLNSHLLCYLPWHNHVLLDGIHFEQTPLFWENDIYVNFGTKVSHFFSQVMFLAVHFLAVYCF